MGAEKMSKATPKLRFPDFREADAWKNDKLGARTASFSGGTPDTSAKEFYGGNIPFIRSAEISKGSTELSLSEAGLGSSAAKLVTRGDVLVALYGANSGDVAIAKVDGAINQAILCLRSVDNNSFLHQYLSAKKDWITATYLQGGQGNLSGDIVKSIVLGFPAAAEQQKIADCLTSLDEVIAAQGRKVETLKAHKRGLMQQLFPRESETRPRLRFPEFRNAPEWKVTKLSALIELVSGTHLAPDQYSSSGDVPYFTGPSDFTNIVEGVTKWTTNASSVATENDTLITVKGSGVGECWYLELPSVAMGRQLMAVRAKASSSQFVHQFLLTKRRRFEDLASGNLIPGLARGDILDMVAPLPKKDEQQRVADCLSSLDAQIAAETNQFVALKTHKQGLMQQLFPSLDGAK